MRADGLENYSKIIVGLRDSGGITRAPFARGGRINAAGGKRELCGIVAEFFPRPRDMRPVAAHEKAKWFSAVMLAVL